MLTLWQDIRYGLRMLAKNPGFTVVTILTLALGLGATTAMFSVVDAILLRPLPFPDSNRVVMIGPEWRGTLSDIAPADYLDLDRRNRSFESMAAHRTWNFNLSAGDRSERVVGAVVTANFFALLRTPPVAGRTLGAGDRGIHVAVLGYSLWQEQFGGRPDVVGAAIPLNGESYTIVGVMPKGFAFPDGAGLWVPARFATPEYPLDPTRDVSDQRDMHFFDTIARLKPGVSLAQAQADTSEIMRQIAKENSGADAASGAKVERLQDVLVGSTRTALIALLGAVALVLLVACANVANLLLARAAARGRELAIRRALGASLGRLARQLVTEGIVLALLGSAAGTLAAFWGLDGLAALVPEDLRDFVALRLDARVLAFAFLAAALTGILVGLAPVFETSRGRLSEVLKQDARSGAGGSRMRSAIVVAETSLAVVLLAGGGLLLRSFYRLMSVAEGFRTADVLTLRISLAETAYQAPAARAAFVAAVRERVQALPGVRDVAIASRLPLVPGGSSRSIVLEGKTYPPDQQAEDIVPDYVTLSPGFFHTIGIPLVRGRDFAAGDTATSPPVAVVSRAAAAAYWPGEDPVGKRLKVDDDTEWREVVGVVGDVRQSELARAPRPMLYLPFPQDPWTFFSIVVHAERNAAGLAPAVEAAVHQVDPHEPVYDVRTYDEILARSVSPVRLRVLLVTGFAGLGVLLAAIGLYGVIAYSVAQRTRELGVRLAMGAQPRDIAALILGQGMRLALAGIGLGVAGALALARVLRSLLFEVSPADPFTYAGVAILLVGVALAACWIPARRATRVDPIVALRYE